MKQSTIEERDRKKCREESEGQRLSYEFKKKKIFLV